MSESAVSTPSTPDVPADKPEQGARRASGGLSGKLLPELKQIAGGLGIKGASTMKKAQLIDAIRSAQAGNQGGHQTGNRMYDFLLSYAWTIAGGANEIIKTVIAERTLGLPRH